jgi:DNA-binding Lrp family transcriptional regulator
MTIDLTGDMDGLDLMIIKELEVDGRQSISAIAKNLGKNRVYISRRLKKLLDKKIIEISSFTHPFVLGYYTFAFIGIKALPNRIRAVAEQLKELEAIHDLVIITGGYDLLAYSLFENPLDVSVFIRKELDNIPGITATETMMIHEVRKETFAYATGAENTDARENSPAWEEAPSPDLKIDRVDLAILRELEIDGRQSVTDLAKKLDISRINASNRLQRLRDNKATKIVAVTNPFILGYHIIAMVGIKTETRQINALSDMLSSFKNIYTVVITSGRYDILVLTMAKGPMGLSHFLTEELAQLPGISSTESMITLEWIKKSSMDLASSHSFL